MRGQVPFSVLSAVKQVGNITSSLPICLVTTAVSDTAAF